MQVVHVYIKVISSYNC